MSDRRIVVDSAHFPLVITRFMRGFQDADVEHMLASYGALLDQGVRYALLVYCDPDAGVVGSRQRRRVSEWYRTRADQVKAINVATAVVLDSALVRGAMTAMQWLVEPLVKQKNFAHIGQGLTFLIEELEQADIEVPMAMYALRDVPEHKLKQLA